MNATPRITTEEWAGRWLGRAWGRFARLEARVSQWLAITGLPARMVRLLFLVMKLAMFGALLFAAFWVVLLLAFVVVVAWLVHNADAAKEKQPEVRDGHSGVGLYDKDDVRIDLRDPIDPWL